MNPKTKRIAIAEACGWRNCKPVSWLSSEVYGDMTIPHPTKPDSLKVWRGKLVPNYLTDLNAMHEAEKVLTDEQRRDYWVQLSLYTEGVGMYPGEATAAQRAEAFLRTIGRWEGKK